MQNIVKLKRDIRKIKTELFLIKKELEQRNSYRKRYISVNEAAIISGVSKSHIQKLIASKQIPHSKPTGKLIFINRKDLEKFLSKNRIASNDEVDNFVSNTMINFRK